MGVVGAAAPTDFEESSFCALIYHEKVPLSSVFGSASRNLHPQFSDPNQDPVEEAAEPDSKRK